MSVFFRRNTLIVVAIMVLIFLVILYYYNRLVKGKIKVKEALSGIDVQLKRRQDLVPNLTRIIRAHSQQAQGKFDQLVNLGNEVLDQPGAAGKADAEAKFRMALGEIQEIASGDPEIYQNSQFQTLSQSLEKIENELQMARRYYNALVREHNSNVETFPSGFVAALLAIKKEEFFQAGESAQDAPEINF